MPNDEEQHPPAHTADASTPLAHHFSKSTSMYLLDAAVINISEKWSMLPAETVLSCRRA